MNDGTINIRSIQHYMYCPRRFALLETNCDWSENAFVVKANLMHEHVHDGTHDFSSKALVARSSVTLYEDELGIFGIADCVEFVPDKSGVKIAVLGGNYRVRIVEYKPKPPKDGGFHPTDAIQVFAQKLCADRIWGCHSEGLIYYTETKKRVQLPLESDYDNYLATLKGLLSEMRTLLESGTIPERRKGQRCGGCSIADVCAAKRTEQTVRSKIYGTMEEL